MFVNRAANIDPETKIRYGYVSAQGLCQELVAALLDEGDNKTYGEARDEFLAKAKEDFLEQEEDGSLKDFDEEAALDEFNNTYYSDEDLIVGEKDGVKYATSYMGGALHFWIIKSPVTGNYSECSFCVPNAANLNQPNEDGVEGYTVPQDWLYDENA